MAFTDIDFGHFVFKHTPAKFHPYIRLARLDRPTGVWLLLLPAWWSITLAADGIFNMGLRDWAIMLGFGMGAILMRAAGCVINDLWDQDLDKKVERTTQRPLASGELTRTQAFKLLAILLGLSFLILICMNKLTILLGVISLIPVTIYPLMKRVTWWPQAFLGITFNWGVWMGWAAVEGSVSMATCVLYVGCMLWTMGYDTIYAHQDKADDIHAGVKSTALLFGEASKRWVCSFYAVSLFLVLAAKAFTFATPILPLLAILLGVYVYKMLKKWDPDSMESSLATFKANRIYGWLVFLSFSF